MQPVLVLFVGCARDHVSLLLHLLVHFLFLSINFIFGSCIDIEVGGATSSIDGLNALDQEMDEPHHLTVVFDNKVQIPRLKLQCDALPCVEWERCFLGGVFGQTVHVARVFGIVVGDFFVHNKGLRVLSNHVLTINPEAGRMSTVYYTLNIR